MIVEAAIQEDVDAILMSILSGAHMAIFPRVMELLKENGVDDVLVAAGGILPDEDLPAIRAMGIKAVSGQAPQQKKSLLLCETIFRLIA